MRFSDLLHRSKNGAIYAAPQHIAPPHASTLLSGPGSDRQGVDIGVHHLTKCSVYRTMPGQRRQAGESRADDVDIEMTASIARPGMAGVLVAIVDDLERLRCKRCFERGADAFDPITALRLDHGSTGLNGRTSTRV